MTVEFRMGLEIAQAWRDWGRRRITRTESHMERVPWENLRPEELCSLVEASLQEGSQGNKYLYFPVPLSLTSCYPFTKPTSSWRAGESFDVAHHWHPKQRRRGKKEKGFQRCWQVLSAHCLPCWPVRASDTLPTCLEDLVISKKHGKLCLGVDKWWAQFVCTCLDFSHSG